MNSSKTANALMTKFNYEEKGYKVLLFKPAIDTRDGKTIIKSRIGLEAEAIIIHKDDSIFNLILENRCHLNKEKIDYFIKIDCIIIDEAQFLTTDQIETLKLITYKYDVRVFCFGLKTDFKSHLFEGSKRLLEIADSITEIKSICKCGRKAIINAKYKDNEIIYDGNSIDIGGSEKYIGLCYECWLEGKLK